jgi:hypothetical protein
MDDDDKTVCTSTTATQIDYIGQEMEEITIRFEIPYRKGDANNDDFTLHTKLL